MPRKYQKLLDAQIVPLGNLYCKASQLISVVLEMINVVNFDRHRYSMLLFICLYTPEWGTKEVLQDTYSACL